MLLKISFFGVYMFECLVPEDRQVSGCCDNPYPSYTKKVVGASWGLCSKDSAVLKKCERVTRPSRPIAAPSKSVAPQFRLGFSSTAAAGDHHQHRFRVLLSICPLPYSVVLTGDGRNGESRVALPPFSYYSTGFGCKGGGGTSGWRQSVPAVLALMYTFLRTGDGYSREKFSDQVKKKCFRAPSRKMSLVALARFSARSEVLVTTRTRKFLIPNLRSWRPRSR